MVNKIFNEEIFDSKHFNTHQDWEVAIPGFFIIAAKRKVRSFAEFTDDESEEFMFILRKIRKGMSSVLGIKDVYFFQNEDTAHGFHFWIFPRLNWMEEFGRKIQSVRPIINYAKENFSGNDEIRKQVIDYAKRINEFMNK